jgi:hypothetical protein
VVAIVELATSVSREVEGEEDGERERERMGSKTLSKGPAVPADLKGIRRGW